VLAPPLTRTLLILTFVTGIVDAASFIGLGQVFAAMQTGNVIFLGLGIGGAAGAPIVAPLIGLVAFIVGGGMGAAVSGHALRFALGLEVALLAAAALIAALTSPTPDTFAAYVLIAGLSLTMGLRGTVTRRVGGANLATTVLNLSLTPFTRPDATVASQDDIVLRGAALLAILLGAVTGALLVKSSIALALAAAAVLVAVAVATGADSTAAPVVDA
jgi:uncharacterized membrane protein YoaK (UPF0700 family)